MLLVAARGTFAQAACEFQESLSLGKASTEVVRQIIARIGGGGQSRNNNLRKEMLRHAARTDSPEDTSFEGRSD